jgi:hypothetical protein
MVWERKAAHLMVAGKKRGREGRRRRRERERDRDRESKQGQDVLF